MFLLSALAAASVAQVAFAQTLSSGCSNALLTVAGSADAACLNPKGLVAIFTTPPNNSLVMPVDDYLKGECAAAACTNTQLAAITTNVTAGCSTELEGLGISSTDNTTDVIAVVEEIYPIVRDVGCLINKSNNTFCITTLLNTLQGIVGVPLTIANLDQYVSALSNPATLPKDVLCSDCVKAALNIIDTAVPDANLTSKVAPICGDSFNDGTTPSNVVEATGTAVPSGTGTSSGSGSSGTGSSATGGALSIAAGSVSGLFASALLLVASGFAVLA